ncbi:MAG: cytosine permease [Candidatus Marsarchaeota archaeon]|nr:cytosine permease [Candidatus Marsarchaeota archaeon]MCL5102044.1 cytosine permease [Candidatus Marsarchaeota archaeon]
MAKTKTAKRGSRAKPVSNNAVGIDSFATAEVSKKGIEVIGVNPIPKSSRTIGSRRVFIFWAMASASALTPLLGELLIKLGITDMLLAMFFGFLIGLVPAGLFAEMGRQIPAPALVVSRKTYGYGTSSAFSLLYTFANLGFFGLNDATGGLILGALTHTNALIWFGIMGVLQIVLVLFGTKWLEFFYRFTSPILIASYAVLTYFLLTSYKVNIGTLMAPSGSFTWGAAISTVVAFSILGWAYKISTVTRFAKPSKQTKGALSRFNYFASAPVAIMLPVFMMGVLGLVSQSVAGNWNVAALSFPALSGITGIVVFVASVGAALAIIHTNAMNLYPATADLLASVQNLFRKKAKEAIAQPIATIVLGTLGVVLAAIGILNAVSGFLDLLAIIIFPFTFIVLVDWYTNMRYSSKLKDFYEVPKGLWANFKPIAIVSTAIAVLINIFGLGPLNPLFNYFPQTVFGSLVGALIYFALFKIFVYSPDKMMSKNELIEENLDMLAPKQIVPEFAEDAGK